MAETSHASLREKIVAVFQTVLPSLGSGESLSLLLTSLEACLSNDAAVFLAAHAEPAGERQRSHDFTVWILTQLILVQGELPDGRTRRRAARFAIHLLRTLHAREPVLLAGGVLQLWLEMLEQLTSPTAGGATLRLVENTNLPPVERRLPAGPTLAAFRDAVLALLLSGDVLQLLVLSRAQLDTAVTCLARLGRTGSRAAALSAVNMLLGERPVSARHRLLRSRLQAPPSVAAADSTAADFTRLTPDAWRGALVSPLAAPEQIVLHMLAAMESAPAAEFTAIYRHTLEATARLLSWPVEAAVQELLVALVSMPWLGAEVNWLDVQPAAGRAEVKPRLEAVIAKLGPAGGSDLADDCLRALVLFPRGVCPLWRAQLAGRLAGQCEVSGDLLPAAALSLSRPATAQLMAAVTSHSQLAPLGWLLCLSAGAASVYRDRTEQDGTADRTGLGRLQVLCSQCDRTPLPDAAERFSDATVPAADVAGVITGAVTSWECSVTSSEHRALVSCLNHTEDRTAVVRAVLALPNASDWSPALSGVLSANDGCAGEADWRPAQMLLCDWLTSLSEAECVRVLRCLLYHARGLSDWPSSRLLAALQRPLVSAEPAVSAAAHLCLQQLARKLQMTPADLWQRHRATVCAALARHLLAAGAPLSRLAAAAAAWDLRSLESLLRAGRRYLLPPLVVAMATDSRADLLDAAAGVLKTKPKDLLIDNYQYVMSHLVLSGRRTDLGILHTFIEAATGVAIAEIRRCSLQAQVNELVLGLHTHREDVIRELGCLAQLDAGGQPSGQPMPLEALVRYLSGCLLGVLGWADARLGSSAASDEEKRQILLSVGELCQLLGRAPVSAVSRKMVATLKAGLSVPDVDHATVWTSLIRALDGPALRALAAELLVTLAPLKPQERDPVLQCLLTERQSDLADVVDELPEVAGLHQLGLRASQAPLADRLARAVRGLAHHSQLVRQHVLLGLRQLLAQHGEQLDVMVRSAGACRAALTRLMDALLAACRDADGDTGRLVAECLGLLGAVDPARLATTDQVVSSAEPAQLAPIASDQFATELLTQLGRAFSAAPDGTTQACASFAMQEVLKIYGVSGGGNEVLWESLPAELRQLLAPMRSSKYQVTASRGRDPPTPVYGSSASSGGHPDWAGLWLTQLSGFVTQQQAMLVFNATRPIACRDVTLAVFLLPHVLVKAVIDGGNAARLSVQGEIEAVLLEERPADAEIHRLCCRSVFTVLDAAAGWRRARLAECGNSSRLLDALRRDDVAFRAVSNFLEHVRFDVVAEASRRCGDQKRALQSLELHLRRHPEELANRLPLLQSLYVSLAEPDGVAGVSATRQEAPSIADQLVLHQSRGQLQDALSCYEHVCNTRGGEIEGYRGLVSCYLSLDQPHSALGLARALSARSDAWQEQLGEQLVEATWRLGQWDELESALEDAPLNSWGAAVGATLLYADQRKKSEFKLILGLCREQEVAPLCSATLEKGSYAREYEHLIRLHILTDMERALPSLLWEEAAPQTTEELTVWQRRLDSVRPAVSFLEPVLAARRAVLTLARDRLRDRAADTAAALDLEISRCWLRSARASREAGQLQRAANCLLQLEPQERRLPEAFVERARLLWLRGDGDSAIRVLRQGVASHFTDWSDKLKAGQLPSEEHHILAEAKLLLARYCEESALMDSSVINQHFVEVTEIRKDWEEVHFYTAKYLDRLLAALPAAGRDSGQLAARVVHALGKSLQYGSRHVYESMPRLLSVWLDYGVQEAASRSQRATDAATVAKNMDIMCRRVGQLLQVLPLYCFLTSLPQIISRICHGRPEVYAQIRDILAALLATYPRQCMWSMLAVSRSSYPMRVERCQDVFSRAKAKKPALGAFISDVTRLADKLVDLSNKPVDKKTSRLSMTAFFPSLRRLVTANFSRILVPLQQQMTVALPETAAQHGADFQPFPDDQVCIAGFEDELEVMPSLVKPKKITLRGTDGRRYTMMAKPKDDLRKDSRLMEFNRLVNRHLASDAEARARNLRIRTYTVIPLNDECGLLQWVPNLNGMRQVLLTQYRRRGNLMTNAELKQVSPRLDDSLETKRAVLEKHLLPRHPPLLSQWLVDTFAEPQAWYTARLNYARTTAVMSMIGYILGLGDRHGENILLDASCGDCVHVDFNCLFNKGELFDWPERVPFRLTHNMVNALGPTGVEGVYRTACEVTMAVMRRQQDALMCVLRPFVHDPLVEWSKQERKTRDVGEIVNERAQAHVGDIEQRLRGQVRSKLKPVPIPLSVAGQVNYLIEEATSVDNLCQMYIGWAAHF